MLPTKRQVELLATFVYEANRYTNARVRVRKQLENFRAKLAKHSTRCIKYRQNSVSSWVAGTLTQLRVFRAEREPGLLVPGTHAIARLEWVLLNYNIAVAGVA